ncbi:hypothetical protein MSG28_006027, partial [Choristoneura fumiferana]
MDDRGLNGAREIAVTVARLAWEPAADVTPCSTACPVFSCEARRRRARRGRGSAAGRRGRGSAAAAAAAAAAARAARRRRRRGGSPRRRRQPAAALRRTSLDATTFTLATHAREEPRGTRRGTRRQEWRRHAVAVRCRRAAAAAARAPEGEPEGEGEGGRLAAGLPGRVRAGAGLQPAGRLPVPGARGRRRAAGGGGGGGGRGRGRGRGAGAGRLRARAVERLWALTEDLNILYKDNWTRLAAQELLDFQRGLAAGLRAGAGRPPGPAPALDDGFHWTFSTSFLYALTLITTIGHGDVAPASAAGRAAAVLYAGLGIPLVLLYLATLGAALARGARRLWARLAPPPPAPAPRRRPQADALPGGAGAAAAGRGARVPRPARAGRAQPGAAGAVRGAGRGAVRAHGALVAAGRRVL